MSWSTVYISPIDLVNGVSDIPYKAKSVNAAREWCRSHGIVSVRPYGARRGKCMYMKTDILRIFEPARLRKLQSTVAKPSAIDLWLARKRRPRPATKVTEQQMQDIRYRGRK